MKSSDIHSLISALNAHLGPQNVSVDDDDRRTAAVDALRRRGSFTDPALPVAVVRPGCTEEVVWLLRIAGEYNLPVVPIGGRTGLMGGARSIQLGIVLDLARMNGIEVHESDRVVWAGAGATLAEVDRACGEYGLAIGHDPWTYGVATVGGTISTNGLGYMGGRYGGVGDQVMGIEAVLADGAVIRSSALARRSTGPDVARLFVGAEGTLGVITAAALRLHLAPESRRFLAFRFKSFEVGFQAVDAIDAADLRPSFLDYGEEHASPWPGLLLREEEAPVLLLGFEGTARESGSLSRHARAITERAGGMPLASSRARKSWRDRHLIAEEYVRNRHKVPEEPATLFDYVHVSLPPSSVLPYRDFCHEQAAGRGYALLQCGLWTAPALFSCIVAAPASDQGRERLDQATLGLLERAQDFGGSMEYVHGVGLRLAPLMRREHGDGFEVLQRIKAALDPYAVLNPGKLGLDGGHRE